MGRARQTFERRQLGLTLRRLREHAAKSQQIVAEVIGKTRARIVQLEDGEGTPTPDDLLKLLDFYEVSDAERTTVLALAAEARKRQKRRVHVDQLPDSYRRLADLEASAIEINGFESGIIPGPLQSRGYIRALFAEGDGVWWESETSTPEDRLAIRLDRQAAIWEAAEPRRLRFVLTEDALRANMGRSEVMGEQLRHLLTLLDRHGNLVVRVLRDDAYGNPARGYATLLFGFGDRGPEVGFCPVVWGPSTYYDDEADTAALRRAFDRVWDLALGAAESRKLIEQILGES